MKRINEGINDCNCLTCLDDLAFIQSSVIGDEYAEVGFYDYGNTFYNFILKNE